MIEELFTQAGVEGSVHAIDHRGAEFGFRSHERIQPASMAKVFVLAALDERIDLTMPVQIRAGDRTPGSTGLSLMADGAVMSVRDLAVSMISISDNHATDVLLDVVTPAAVTAALRRRGLNASRLDGRGRDLLHALNTGDEATIAPATSPWSTTARDLTWLMHGLWRDGSEQIRTIIGTQVISRFAAGFADVPVSIASKTGTLREHRGETGIVAFPDGTWVAVTVAVRTSTFEYDQRNADDAIARAARAAVDSVRAQS